MIKNIPYIEKYVANLEKETDFLVRSFGFNLLNKAQHSNGNESTILEEGNVRIILTSGKEAREQIDIHGDFIKDVAFELKDIESTYDKAIEAGFKPLLDPVKEGDVKLAQISTFGNSIHTLIETKNTKETSPKQGNFQSIDHIAIAVDDLDYWSNLYEKGLNLKEFSKDIIETDKTGMYSRVLNSSNNKVSLFFAAPKKGKLESQIDKYLEENTGSGIQHIALCTKDIITVIKNLKSKNVKFVSPPDNYYEEMAEDLRAKFQDNLNIIRELQIFIDQDYNGEMLQIFTEPLQDRSTFFLEIIQRDKAITFGRNNVLALFRALEQKFQNA